MVPPDNSNSFDTKKSAVALEYDHAQDPAPRIVASGKGPIAEQIIAIAKEHGITIHEDAELAQILSVLEVDSLIPLEAYTAVAEILAYIYKKNAAS